MSGEARQGTALLEGDHPACSTSRKPGIPEGRARVQCLTGWGKAPQFLWTSALLAMAASSSERSFRWWRGDILPLRPGWWN